MVAGNTGGTNDDGYGWGPGYVSQSVQGINVAGRISSSGDILLNQSSSLRWSDSRVSILTGGDSDSNHKESLQINGPRNIILNSFDNNVGILTSENINGYDVALSAYKNYYQENLRAKSNEKYDYAEGALTLIFINE